MNSAFFKFLLLSAACSPCFTTAARAEMAFNVSAGYSSGTLSREVDEKFATIMTLGTVGYNYKDFNIHGFFQSMDLAYKNGDNSYNGVYALSGLGLSYRFIPSKRGYFSASLQRPLSGTYIVLSENSTTVKGDTYQYSELTSLYGGSALQFMTGYEFLIYGKGSSKKGENFTFGLQLGYLKQDFATQSTRIKTNNSDISPLSTGDVKVGYSVTILSLLLSANYDI